MAQFPSTQIADGIWNLKKVRRAASTSNWPTSLFFVEYLVVAGGGGGGAWVAGGGGAGGLISGRTFLSPNNTYTITVGSGGVREYNPGAYSGMPRATNGGNSSAFEVTAIGGGCGGSWNTFLAQSGGSGGGNGFSYAGALGVLNQGFAGGAGRGASDNGYPTGGGGGAGGPGGNWTTTKSGNGGIGYESSITGTPTYYAGGGGGGVHGGGTGVVAEPGDGGLGGGGAGDRPNTGSGAANPNNTSFRLNGSTYPTGESGVLNTGGGGGGGGSGGSFQSAGGTGGSGVVILRTRSTASATTGSPTVTTDGSYNIYTFTASGSITF